MSKIETEVLVFTKGDQIATIVTDGTTHKTYELKNCQSHGSLNMAISHLEAMGYSIQADYFNAN